MTQPAPDDEADVTQPTGACTRENGPYEDDGRRYDPYTFLPIDDDSPAADDDSPIASGGNAPARNVWAASIDWVAVLEKQMAEADERARERERLHRLRQLGAPQAKRRTYPLGVGQQRGSSAPISVRLPRWLEEQIRLEFESMAITPSTALRQILEEWWVPRRYPALEYRGAGFLRLAAIRGGPTVIDWIAADRQPALPDLVHTQVLDYVELFRERIEAELEVRRSPDRPR